MKYCLMGITALIALACVTSCQQENPDHPTNFPMEPERVIPNPTFTREWIAPRELTSLWPRGRWIWDAKITQREGSSPLPVLAILEVRGELLEDEGFQDNQERLVFSWCFGGSEDVDIGSNIVLTYCLDIQSPHLDLIPRAPASWHGIMDWYPANGSDTGPFPFPVFPLPNSASGNLLGLLKTLTANFFESTTCHWPSFPIPVRVGHAQSGQVNLSECLIEALQRWNDDGGRPWFQVQEAADWGVQLVHFPGVIRHPPLQARITRLDDEGRPMRVQILVGDNYNTFAARPYAIRGFVHELGHALFLWGHSPDRAHVLWGMGPPLVDRPSNAERKAAQLMHGLPEGLDLKKYFSAP